jgi:mRNA-degrading endonuclease HigB of HigAB toxin-antitoxin module
VRSSFRSQKKYVEVKRQVFVIDGDEYKVIEIIDISAKILFNQASIEKKMLSMSNATVSHEMRTPINSISC